MKFIAILLLLLITSCAHPTKTIIPIAVKNPYIAIIKIQELPITTLNSNSSNKDVSIAYVKTVKIQNNYIHYLISVLDSYGH